MIAGKDLMAMAGETVDHKGFILLTQSMIKYPVAEFADVIQGNSGQ